MMHRCLLVLFLTLVGTQASNADRPNVLFISVDDLNDWIGCMRGHPQARTPNLDRLAASGVLFTNAHCPAPACNPSRGAIMTGISPHVSGLYDNRQKMRERMPDAELSAKILFASWLLVSGVGKAAALLHRRAVVGRILPAQGNGRSFPAYVLSQAATGEPASRRSLAVRRNRLGCPRCFGRRVRRRLACVEVGRRTARSKARQAILSRVRDLSATRTVVCSEGVLRAVSVGIDSATTGLPQR